MSDVKTLLLLSSEEINSSFSILFHCAKYWALQGNRVLFVSETPLTTLPMNVGRIRSPYDVDVFKLIQFMYLPSWQDLLKQLCCIHLRNYPVSAIIVKNIENYFKSDKGIQNEECHTSLICASLLNATSTCAKIVSKPAILISNYVSKESQIERIVVKNFFSNVWELKYCREVNDRTLVKLSKLLCGEDEVEEFLLSEDMSDSQFLPLSNQKRKKWIPKKHERSIKLYAKLSNKISQFLKLLYL